MFAGKTSGHSRSGLALRSLRVGVSLTGLLMAGSALAQVQDLGGVQVQFRDQAPLDTTTEITNGIAAFFPRLTAPDLTYAGALTDSLGQLTVTMTGSARSLTLTGSGLNTHSGNTSVVSGTLRAGADNVFSPNSVLSISSGGATADLLGTDQSAAGLIGGGILTNSEMSLATLTITNTSPVLTNFTGTSTGNLRIVKAGTGTQGFGEASTRTGGTELQAGILRFGRAGALGTGALDVTGNAILEAGRDNLTLGNDINLSSGVVLTLDTSRTTLSGKISGDGGLRKAIRTIDLNLTNSDNDFTGGFLLENGQVNVVSGALGTGVFQTGADQVSMGLAVPGTTVILANDIELGGTLNFELGDAASVLRLNGDISGGKRGKFPGGSGVRHSDEGWQAG